MELFRWMGVGSSHSTSNSHHGPKGAGVKKINHADYKQFGLENFGNTCYANSVLQALYFCQPFRELVCDSHDKSNPAIPSTPLAPSQPTLAPPSRPPGLKGFRRRDSSIDGGRTVDDPPPNGLANGKFNTTTASSGPPIPVSPPTLFSALRSLFLHIAMNASDKGTVSPTSFINKLKKENELYRSTMHQDAHEFLGFLLNKIVEDLEVEMKRNAEMGGDDVGSSFRSSPSASASTSTTSPSQSNSSDSQKHRQPNRTFVHSLFEGTLTSETRCLTCETVSSRDESFLDLSIDIEQNSSVTACLRQFSASEMLSQKNKFFCDSCGGLQEAEKRMKIKKLPNVLALHLKRFKYQEDVQKYIKLSYRVAFPFELRLFNTVDDAPDPDRLYQLFAIVVHIGGGPHHGHYIAIIKAHGTWFIFDDDAVEPIREVDIPKYFGESPGGAGYVLFYQAVDLDLASVGIDSTDEVAAPEAQADFESSADASHERQTASVSASESPVQLRLEIPTVVKSGLPSADATPTISSILSAKQNGNGHMEPSSLGRSPGRPLKHSQSARVTNSFDKERDRRQPPSSNHQLSEADGVATGDANPPVPLGLLGSPLSPTRSLKAKEKDKEGGAGGWFSTRRKDKKDRRSVIVPVPPLPHPVVNLTASPRDRATFQLESPPSGRKHSIRPEEEADTRLLPPAPAPASSSTSRSYITHSSAFTPSSLSSAQPPLPQPPQSPQASSKSHPPVAISSIKMPPRPVSSPSSLVSLPLPSAHNPDPVPPVPTPVPVPPVPPQRVRKLSQTFPPPTTGIPERPSTAGPARPKRASRKMSLTAIPLAGLFSRRERPPPPPLPPNADRPRDDVPSDAQA